MLQSGLLALPTSASAQAVRSAGSAVTVGVLTDYAGLPDPMALRDELARLGWRDGSNLRLETRVVDARLQGLDAAAGELLALNPAALIVLTDGLAQAVKRRHAEVPIVITLSRDPIGAGLAASMQRPGGSVTGLMTMYDDIRPKLFQLARQVVPRARRFAGMFFYAGPPNAGLDAILARGRDLARQFEAEYLPLQVRDTGEIEKLLAGLKPAADHVLLVDFSAGMAQNYARIAALARAAKLASASVSLRFAEQGGLLGYGPDIAAYSRRVGAIVDQLLRGARAGDIPIEQPTLIRMLLNLRTAREIGIAIPDSLRARADEVIE